MDARPDRTPRGGTPADPVPGDAAPTGRSPSSRRARDLRHVHPRDVTLQEALDALSDPVRRSIVQALAAEPDFARACGTFDLPVAKATASHHFAVLRSAGLIEQVDVGPRRLNRLRRGEFDACFPGLLTVILAERRPTAG
jgi:DNA-binding transcriptional ArsR family regulator